VGVGVAGAVWDGVATEVAEPAGVPVLVVNVATKRNHRRDEFWVCGQRLALLVASRCFRTLSFSSPRPCVLLVYQMYRRC